MNDPKIRILKRLDRIAAETVAKSKLAAIALRISEKVGMRSLTGSVNEWVTERNENRASEQDESRKQIRTWKEEQN